MRILMLGWEFPPFIAGGLGVACYGLTKALDKQGHHVTFILPRPVDRTRSSHVKLLSPMALSGASMHTQGGIPLSQILTGSSDPAQKQNYYGFQHAIFIGVPATFRSPYGDGGAVAPGNSQVRPVNMHMSGESAEDEAEIDALLSNANLGSLSAAGVQFSSNKATGAPKGHIGDGGGAGHGYGNDLLGDAERYARLCVALTRREQFDVVHAHDWLTYPAGVALSRVSGKPLIVQVHSTEFDRSGTNVNQRVYDVERMGMQNADRVICVSQFTADICKRRYGVLADKIDVVYNGVERESQQPKNGTRIEDNDKIVLFLGRITMQKGPEYFITAAKRVLEKVPHAKFVLAGSGDMALRMIELAASMGIGSKVLFTGFLRGPDIEKIYRMADCYVMPSVSEPFGIAALEAISHDVPVILSKTSGASEVLRHVLKVDFWDIDEMANKIVAVLKHPPLGRTLREHGQMELHRLTWDEAGKRCIESYGKAVTQRKTAAASA